MQKKYRRILAFLIAIVLSMSTISTGVVFATDDNDGSVYSEETGSETYADEENQNLSEQADQNTSADPADDEDPSASVVSEDQDIPPASAADGDQDNSSASAVSDDQGIPSAGAAYDGQNTFVGAVDGAVDYNQNSPEDTDGEADEAVIAVHITAEDENGSIELGGIIIEMKNGGGRPFDPDVTGTTDAGGDAELSVPAELLDDEETYRIYISGYGYVAADPDGNLWTAAGLSYYKEVSGADIANGLDLDVTLSRLTISAVGLRSLTGELTVKTTAKFAEGIDPDTLFTFAVTDDADAPIQLDGAAGYSITGAESVSGNTFTLKDGGIAVISDIPYGDIKVEETGPDGYTTVSKLNGANTNLGKKPDAITIDGTSKELEFANTQDTACLTFRKSIENGAWPKGAFTFYLYLDDTAISIGGGYAIYSYTLPSAGYTGTWKYLALGQTYTLYEEISGTFFPRGDGWELSVVPGTAKPAYKKDFIAESNDTRREITVANALTELTVTKEVAVGDTSKEFTFQVQDKDGNPVSFTGSGKTWTYSTTGEVNFTFKDGETFTFFGLPLDEEFKAVETDSQGYAASGDHNVPFTFSRDDYKHDALIVNTLDTSKTQLLVTKRIAPNSYVGSHKFTIKVEGDFSDGDIFKEYVFAASPEAGEYAFGTEVDVDGVIIGEAYKITESAAGSILGFYISTPLPDNSQGEVVITANDSKLAGFTNEREKSDGTLKITKLVNGTWSDGVEFEFILTRDGQPRAGLTDVDNTVTTGADGSFKLTKANPSVSFTGLEDGAVYAVKEIGIPTGYALESIQLDGSDNGIVSDVAYITVSRDGNHTVTVTNAATPPDTELTIIKKVESGNGASSAGTYTFVISNNGQDVPVTKTSDGYIYDPDSTSFAIEVSTAASAEPGISGEGSVKVSHLPLSASAYTVRETNLPEGYSLVSISGNNFSFTAADAGSSILKHTVTAVNRRNYSGGNDNNYSRTDEGGGISIPDSDVPRSNITILDDDVPLANLPSTGGMSDGSLGILTALAITAIAVSPLLLISRKKRTGARK